MNILLIEDNKKMGENIATVLKSENYIIDTVGTVINAQYAVADNAYDLIILDLALPDGDGIALCKELRDQGFTNPILMLTAKISLESKVEGLDSGADDYLTKPFLMEELLARIRALSRRFSSEKQSEIRIGDLTIDLSTKTIRRRTILIELSPIEMRIIECLLLSKGHIKTSTELYDSVWGGSEADIAFSETLKVHISRLRKKIGKEIIQTVPGFGYIIK